MNFLMNHPLLFLLLTFVLLWGAARFGMYVRKARPENLDEDDFDLATGATLTLVGLIIGFTFSMAVGRYDQRKNYEEEEANAIGTEYVRLDLLPTANAAELRLQLREYLVLRIAYYESRDPQQLPEINAKTAQLQNKMWNAVSATGQRDPVTALAISGMNDVLNRQGYTEAAWLNRVPVAAWILLVAIALFSNFLVGFRAHSKVAILLLVLPVALSISFFLIADIDSPRGGVIRVHPQNLETLAESLRSH